MLKNYIKIAWRNLMKNKTFTFINIFGLSFSVAFCMLLFLHIRFEQSFDKFHVKSKNLYRLETTNMFDFEIKKPDNSLFSWLTKNDDADNNLSFAMQMSPDMLHTFPEIRSISSFHGDGLVMMKAGDRIFKEENILYTDSNFFKPFSFQLLKGNPATCLSSPDGAVISRTTAIKYFGSIDVIGKSISSQSEQNYLFKITGVMEDIPLNSGFQFNILLPNEAIPQYKNFVSDRLNHLTHTMILELAPDIDLNLFKAKLNKWYTEYFTKPFNEKYKYTKSLSVYLRNITDCHYNASAYGWHFTDAKSIYQLSCLVLVILLIASLNYVLLAVSNTAGRSQEVGVRKVLGAGKHSIIFQFWIETQVVVLLAVSFSLVLINLLLPVFNSMINTHLELRMFSWKEVGTALISLSVILGLTAGYYPARILSSTKPASILKSFSTFKVKPGFSKILVVVQYSFCIVLILAALVINRQMNFISNKDLGFDKEQVLMVSNQTYDKYFTQKIRDRLFAFAEKEPAILGSSILNGGLDGSANTNGYQLHGEQKFLKELSVDYDYFKLLNLKLVKGRLFSREINSDTSVRERRVVVNETLWNLLGDSAKLNEYNEIINRTIIGVVKDYHFASLTEKIQPQQHALATTYVDRFIFKIGPGKMNEEIERIRSEWKSITGNYPFEFTFLDQTINKMYDAQMRWQKTVTISCFFAVFIACMGLFGLSAINAINRTKEIGIRKVLGATVTQVVTSLSKNFLVMVGMAIIIALPVAWWMMNKWLEDFAYRIQLSGWMLFLAAAVAILIALVAVGYQAVKAAMANPVESLRSE